MKIDGFTLNEGSEITNLTVATGASFPSTPNDGELFYLNTGTIGLYVYQSSAWVNISSGSSLAFTDLSNVTITTAADGDVVVFNASAAQWVNATLINAGIAPTIHTHADLTFTDAIYKDGAGNTLYGTGASTHVVFGDSNTTSYTGGATLYCAVLGGTANKAVGNYAVVVNGSANNANKPYSFIGNGFNNSVLCTYGFIGNGSGNLIQGGTNSFIGGGSNHTLSGSYNQFIGGGALNSVSGDHSLIVGGQANVVTSSSGWAAIVGGKYNTTTSTYQFIGAGTYNTASALNTSIVGGDHNTVSADYGFVGGGQSNSITGQYSAVLGGKGNRASHNYATTFGGAGDTRADFDVIIAATSSTTPSVNNNTIRLEGTGGNIHMDGSVTTPEADYAEYFEWADLNSNNEDRVGFFVSLNASGMIVTDNSNVIGIVSATPSIVGDACENHWKHMYDTDIWGRKIYDTYTVYKIDDGTLEGMEVFEGSDTTLYDIYPQPTNPTGVIHTNALPASAVMITTIISARINPAFDPNAVYVPRSERPEWDAIGLMGKLYVRASNVTTSKVGVGADGKAIDGSTYNVISVINASIIQILFK